MVEERAVHPDCRNASNPYHECSDYCFNVIAEAKLKNASDSGWFFLSIVNLKVLLLN